MRYMYVNERSIIENYMRAIMGVSLEYSHITETVFQEMHYKSFQCDFTDAEYSFIKSLISQLKVVNFIIPKFPKHNHCKSVEFAIFE